MVLSSIEAFIVFFYILITVPTFRTKFPRTENLILDHMII